MSQEMKATIFPARRRLSTKLQGATFQTTAMLEVEVHEGSTGKVRVEILCIRTGKTKLKTSAKLSLSNTAEE
jgi:hypothetical protein